MQNKSLFRTLSALTLILACSAASAGPDWQTIQNAREAREPAKAEKKQSQFRSKGTRYGSMRARVTGKQRRYSSSASPDQAGGALVKTD